MSRLDFTDAGRRLVTEGWHWRDRELKNLTVNEECLCVLIDIATSLRAIRTTLDCPNTVDIPRILRAIRANTAKPKRKPAKKRARRKP